MATDTDLRDFLVEGYVASFGFVLSMLVLYMRKVCDRMMA